MIVFSYKYKTPPLILPLQIYKRATIWDEIFKFNEKKNVNKFDIN